MSERSGFGRYWTGAAISSFGGAVTAVAMPVLVIQSLNASAVEVGLVNAAQLIPYAVLRLLAGAYVDRWRRKPVLVWSSVGRAVTLGLVPVLGLLGAAVAAALHQVPRRAPGPAQVRRPGSACSISW